MNRLTKFTSNGVDLWVDTSEVCGVAAPIKSYKDKGWFSKGNPIWTVNFYHKSGYSGRLVCWCEELAINYCKMLRKENVE